MKREQFEKLKQLDRIEYILRAEAIDRHNSFYFFSTLGGIVVVWFYILVLGMLAYIAFENTSLIYAILKLRPLFAGILIFVIIFDAVTLFRRLSSFKKLDKKFAP